jgi:hypothetical protein
VFYGLIALGGAVIGGVLGAVITAAQGWISPGSSRTENGQASDGSLRVTCVFGTLFASPILGLELISWADTGQLEGFLTPGWATMPVVAFARASLAWGVLVVLFKSRSILLGALTGIASAAFTLAVPTRYLGKGMPLRQYDGEGGWGVAVGVYSLAMYWIMGVAFGAALGAVVMVVRRARLRKVEEGSLGGSPQPLLDRDAVLP